MNNPDIGASRKDEKNDVSIEINALSVRAHRFIDKWDKLLDKNIIPSRKGFACESIREERDYH